MAAREPLDGADWPGHAVICGNLGEGKSTLGMELWRRLKGGGIWWDPSDDQKVPEWAVSADPGCSPAALTRCLKAGRKIVWHAGALTDKRAQQQVSVLAQLCSHYGCALAIDEAHKVYAQGRPNETVKDLVYRGRHLRTPVILMDPSPADVDKSIFKVGVAYLFDCPFQDAWMRDKGIPTEAMQAVRAAGRHHYVRVSAGRVEGPFCLSA